jgi:hypothetical protein
MVVDRYGDRVLAPTTASKVEQVLQ